MKSYSNVAQYHEHHEQRSLIRVTLFFSTDDKSGEEDVRTAEAVAATSATRS